MPSAADGYHPLDVQASSMRGSWAGAGSVTLAGLATRCSQSSRSATSVRVKLSASEPIRPPSESFAALPPSRRSTRQVMSPHRPAPRVRHRAQRLPFVAAAGLANLMLRVLSFVGFFVMLAIGINAFSRDSWWGTALQLVGALAIGWFSLGLFERAAVGSMDRVMSGEATEEDEDARRPRPRRRLRGSCPAGTGA